MKILGIGRNKEGGIKKKERGMRGVERKEGEDKRRRREGIGRRGRKKERKEENERKSKGEENFFFFC